MHEEDGWEKVVDGRRSSPAAGDEEDGDGKDSSLEAGRLVPLGGKERLSRRDTFWGKDTGLLPSLSSPDAASGSALVDED